MRKNLLAIVQTYKSCRLQPSETHICFARWPDDYRSSGAPWRKKFPGKFFCHFWPCKIVSKQCSDLSQLKVKWKLLLAIVRLTSLVGCSQVKPMCLSWWPDDYRSGAVWWKYFQEYSFVNFSLAKFLVNRVQTCHNSKSTSQTSGQKT